LGCDPADAPQARTMRKTALTLAGHTTRIDHGLDPKGRGWFCGVLALRLLRSRG